MAEFDYVKLMEAEGERLEMVVRAVRKDRDTWIAIATKWKHNAYFWRNMTIMAFTLWAVSIIWSIVARLL